MYLRFNVRDQGFYILVNTSKYSTGSRPTSTIIIANKTLNSLIMWAICKVKNQLSYSKTNSKH